MTQVLGFAGDMLAPLALVVALEFMVAYHRMTGGAWIHSQMGRHLMVFMGVLAAVFAVIVSRWVWVQILGNEDNQWFSAARLMVFACLPAVMIWRRVLLSQAQRNLRVRGKERF